MSIKIIGKDITASSYWTSRDSDYGRGINTNYHAHRLSVLEHLIDCAGPKKGLCLDVGCGEGVLAEFMAKRGFEVLAYDLSEPLVDAARERLQGAGHFADIRLAGMELLAELPSASVDIVLVANVMAYLTNAEEAFFYEHVRRVAKPGAEFIVTHSNELFDLFTLNAYTVNFFSHHLGVSKEMVSSLLVNPNLPERVTFNIRENPLSYPNKLRGLGWEEHQQEFINLHEVPPLMMDPTHTVDLDVRSYRDTLNWPPEMRWKLMFVCSMFGSRSVRGGG